ncbi:bifunctional 4-hydroxy-2-oxoglutarate aldolase/2-dehydro-3-deoxy-phosphogluconate aldolase [Bacillus sp. FSL W8-0645]|uniref:bifunctional 4-hydroxy-2-oxoglutarate aldolase/2-dehydro-3-deoxy-phosphogluconate aldolase n=1 Tax=Bacillus TaxID=1386 RepID=UPI002280A68B|nr:bifunctional 4-hydroxy-2-oxoglutarate aldolase/2-dehydro-3-deoxy-phosphogluconate aldolase [Bacillus pumilus]MCY7539161.1 bifunctional 4-hydroxy-2-oxoglutarate aldolase/2-dehydro-3-deoxy-phosphogluconate aldolase [Bacillus pumilus]MEC3591852.1 bifunctional 4-hydroxy-2-oxoglutarate aldolase/2-dehydro-3-deoxy-phosphogluconate aldolase [Bacillus pumilus]WHX44500.1 bifunctional 4-hydroxy-2-oxoglutarate aldolase/2-dehydro-3-deoxy-phosphogluconate aldolase [Bacillus pumilus]
MGKSASLSVKERLAACKLIAVVRAESEAEGIEIIERLKKKGVRAIEVTYTTPNAEHIIASFQHEQDLIVGAGTITTLQQAQSAIDAGSQFIVSPGYLPVIGEHLSFHDTLYVPGVLTPSEIMHAKAAGYCLLKLFPSGSFGLSYMKNLQGPFPDIEFIPTGGIHPADVPKWLKAGAVAVGVGSQLESSTAEELQAVLSS